MDWFFCQLICLDSVNSQFSQSAGNRFLDDHLEHNRKAGYTIDLVNIILFWVDIMSFWVHIHVIILVSHEFSIKLTLILAHCIHCILKSEKLLDSSSRLALPCMFLFLMFKHSSGDSIVTVACWCRSSCYQDRIFFSDHVLRFVSSC